MTSVSAAGEDCVGCGSVLCTEVSKFLNRRSLFHSVTIGLVRYVVKAGILLLQFHYSVLQFLQSKTFHFKTSNQK